jgi:Asp-tRNA(Asn)/Glu-tRNA(Gln) amidotransferase A subunit family amidase
MVVQTCIDRISARENDVHAWAYFDPEHALAQAKQLEQASIPKGPLFGLPIGIKDVLLTHDMPTQYNCEIYKGHFPKVDSAAVAMLRAAGAIILGKTATVELASIGAPPETRNPHNLAYTPGGSSSGSAAAVADCHVPLALGTQTGGSIIRPASYCGVWALKPTWGAAPTDGCKKFAPSLDTIGWFGRSPADLALLLNVLAPDLGNTRLSLPLEGARIAVWRTQAWDRAQKATRDALENAIDTLSAHGALISTFPEHDDLDDLIELQRIVMLKEGQKSFEPDYRMSPDRLHPRVADLVRTGGGYTNNDLAQALHRAGKARKRFDELCASFDAVLAPSTPGEAPHGIANTGDLVFNGLFTLLRAPCVNMPLWRAANGMPVGLTLTGPQHSDHSIIALAETIGRALA